MDSTIEESFLRLTKKEHRVLLDKASKLVDGEDALQNVLERMLRNGGKNSEGYVSTAIRNASIDLWRARTRRIKHEADFAASISEEDETTPFDNLQFSRLIDALTAAIEALSTLDQELFERRFLSGDPVVKIAVDLKLHRSTVEKRLLKIKRHCYQVMEPLL
ncbi:MAG: sigma-70 family RNA polymerase sigma factor [Pseudomonadota bacterium]